MKLHEHEAKHILSNYGISIPCGGVALTPNEARRIAANLRPPFVVKAQVLVAGRGKAGGILFCRTVEEAGEAAGRLLGKQVKDIPVKKVLVEEKIPIVKELYFGLTVDRVERKYVLIASKMGGMQIDEAIEAPRSVVKTIISTPEIPKNFDADEIVDKMGYKGAQSVELAKILSNLCRAGMEYDAELIETNPLAETADGCFIATDARVIIDDNSLFRHSDLKNRFFSEELGNTPMEVEAIKSGLAYVKLNGDIGVLGNGAGLVMATLDVIQYYGGKPADFLDLGGGAPVERIQKALEIVRSDPNVLVVLVNILGGITHCDDVALAITETKKGTEFSQPFIVRLLGINESEGKRILEQSGIITLDTMEEAVEHAVEAARKAH